MSNTVDSRMDSLRIQSRKLGVHNGAKKRMDILKKDPKCLISHHYHLPERAVLTLPCFHDDSRKVLPYETGENDAGGIVTKRKNSQWEMAQNTC